MSVRVHDSATVAAQTGSLLHARILWDSVSRRPGAAVSASSAAAGFPAAAAASPDTYSFWRPSAANAWWKIDAGAAVTVNAVGIAVHDLFTQAATLTLEHSDNDADWTSVDSFAPASNRDILWLFPVVEARYWRLSTGASAVPTIASIYVGEVLAMERALYLGHTPVTMARETVIRPAVSEGGQWLGRTIVRRGYSTRAGWRHLTPAWYRSTFEPFALAARTYPFFFAWRPGQFPAEIGYVWTPGDVTPSVTGPRGMLSVELKLHGFAPDE